MKGIETGKDKVKKICEVLRKETLEPAKREADDITEKAREQAEGILSEARRAVEKMHAEAKAEIQRQRNVFQSSLNQACKQALEALKQDIEEKLFSRELGHLIARHTQEPKILAQLTTAVVEAIQKHGIDADLTVYIPAAVPPKAVNALLAQHIIDKLREKSVLVGLATGGIQVKLHKENITIDISDTALKELVANYIRKDFREILFGSI